jgi:hypothetical protein
MTDTPRTDEAVRKSYGQWSFVIRDTCRDIERELNVANQQIEELKQSGDELAKWATAIYRTNHLFSLEQYKDIKKDIQRWEKAIQ